MATRTVTEVLRDDRGRVLALCNPDDGWSPRRAQDVMRDIRFDLHSYVAVADGKQADILVVGGHTGGYLRSEADASAANNLDKLPSATAGNSLTGASDVVLQVREDVSLQLLRAMHRVGAMPHRALSIAGNTFLELVLGAPVGLTLVPSEPGDTVARARVDVPLLYRARPADGSAVLGDLASAILHVRARVGSRIAPDGVQLLIEWTETQDADVEVLSVEGGATAHDVAAAIGTWARAQGSLGQGIRLPGLTGTAPLSELTTTFRSKGGERLVSASVSFGSSLPKDGAELRGEVFLDRDWGLALSEHLVTERIRSEVRASIGGLPPPLGPAPVPLPGENGIFIDTFDVRLSSGKIVFEGTLRQASTPVVTASYDASIKLDISGGQVRATVDTVTVQTHEWYASLLNFISGGAIADGVARAVRLALGAGAAGQISTLFSPELLRSIAAAGTTRGIDVEPTVDELAVDEAGIVVQGGLRIPDPGSPPVADLSVYPSARGTRWRILHAGGSWAPGGSIARFHISCGDGHDVELAGAHARFAVEHEFPAGTFTVRLTVTDDRGASTSVSQSTEVQ